jgi:sugar O-acyltransferase (sialic acid O-acetyltransferase NeuD family)
MSKGDAKLDLLVYGASGHGKVIIDAVIKEGNHRVVGIIDDDPKLWKGAFCGYRVIGGESVIKGEAYRNCKLILAVGDNAARKKLWRTINALGYELACAVHPSAQIGRNVFIGVGTVIMANTAINSGTKIGENTIINTGSTIDHDCVLEDYVHITPGAHLAGNVHVGELTHIGIGASVIQGVKIGRNVIIGAGAAVIDDLPDNVTAVGVPAKVIKKQG